MAAAKQRGKHRSARRPVTPLTVLAGSVSSHAGTIGRSTAVVAVGSGLIASGGAMAAQAADTPASTGTTIDASFISDAIASPTSAKALIEAKSIATAPADAEWSDETADAPEVKVTKPKPKPKPVLVADDADGDRAASRSGRGGGATATKAELRRSSSFQTGGNAVLEVAKRYVGVPYVWAGSTPKGFDCSGFTMYVFGQLGYKLPHSSSAQMNSGKRIPASKAQPGDLFITPGHVAIYAGGGMQIDAPRTGKTIQFRPMWTTNGTFVRVGK